MSSAIGSILYIRRKHGWPLREIVAMWVKAGLDRRIGLIDWLHPEGRTQGDNFFSAAARRMYDEATNWYCVEGCCVVIWSQGKNVGGYGTPGCPCDEMDEPRDLSRGPIPASPDLETPNA